MGKPRKSRATICYIPRKAMNWTNWKFSLATLAVIAVIVLISAMR